MLVAGGVGVSVSNLASCEIYTPATGKWTMTGPLHFGRYTHSATLLSDGGVLVAGGTTTSYAPTNTAEVYNPTAGSWSLVGNTV